MKRQHNIPGLEGLVVYLPLAYDGDLTDKITGNSIQMSGNGSMVWDNTYGAYKITTPSTSDLNVGFLSVDLTTTVFPDDCYTSLVTFRRISTLTGSTQQYINLNTTTTAAQPAPFCNYDGTAVMNTYPYEFVKLAMVFDPLVTNLRYFIQDGVLYTSIPVFAAYLPSLWGINPLTSGLNFGNSKGTSGYMGKQYCIKDIYLFNRALSLDEIKEIQGIV